MRLLFRLSLSIFIIALFIPFALFATETDKPDLNMIWSSNGLDNSADSKIVWSVSGEANSSALNLVWSKGGDYTNSKTLAWNSSLMAASLPDSIIQIKTVKAGVDLDQDGKLEFMVPVLWVEDGVNRRSLFVFEATGNNSYDNVWSYQFPGVGDQFVTVDVSDLDGDGNQEILAVNVPAEDDNGPNLYVFEYKGNDNDYGAEPTVTWDLGSTERDIVRVAKAADLDNDGKQEVVLTSFNTQPAIVIASVSDFNLPVWTSEYVNNEIGGVAPDIAAIGIGDMDNDGTPEVVLTEGATDKLLIIEASAADTYAMNEVDMPVAAKTVSVHGIDVDDVNGDGRDEAYIANLQGSVWVVATSGDASAITTANIYRIADTEEQWLEAALGDLGGGGMDFVIAASNGCKAVDYRYVGGQYGDVTSVDNYQSKVVVDSSDVAMIVPGGVRVYGLDLPGDMDGDGLPEIIFTRGSTRGGHTAPAIFIMEIAPSATVTASLPDSILQIKTVTAGVDLDQDGKLEFMVPVLWLEDGVNRRSLFVFEATGNNSYDNVWGYQFPGVGDQFVTVDVSDLDGDGNQEILAVNVPAEDDNGPNLYVFEYKGNDNDYGSEPTVTWDLGSTERDIVRVAKAADLDNDGKQEVVLTSFNTQPAIVIASVSDFNLPVWTSEYVNNDIGGVAPDIAAIGIGDMDNDGTPEVVLTEGATDKLLIIEATGADAYAMNEVDMPVAAKTVSVHGIDLDDVNGDGRDEAYIANLQGSVWVIATNGDASAISTADIYRIADTEEQWLEAALGDLGSGGMDFVIAASNACKAVDYRYVGGQYGDVTNVDNYQSKIVVDSSDVAMIVPGGVRVYGIDLPGDMDGDGLPEIIFTRGSTRGGHDAPAIFIMEVTPNVAIGPCLPDSILQIKTVKAGVDLDKDGKEEFMVPVLWLEDGVKRRSLFVYEATGNNSYDNIWSYQFPGIGDQFVTVDVSDLDGDGNLEILAVNVPAEDDNGPNLYVFEYKGNDNDYGSEPTVTWDLGSTERDIVRVAKAADLDNDGKQEVVLTCFNTQPAIVIASVSDFNLPVWTSEYVNNEIGGVAPDIAAIGIGDMDNDGTPEVVLTEGATDKLLIIEATGADAYAMNEVDMPVAAKTVSVHGIDLDDVNGDGRDETYIANLQGSVWVIATNGDASAISTADIYRIADTEEQWLEAALGDLGAGGADFVIAASNGCKAVDYRYVGGQYGDVTNVDNYQSKIVVDSSDVAMIVPGGVRVYGLDLPGDMDGDGLPEIIFTRGSTRGGHTAPAIFIMEFAPSTTVTASLPDSILQIKTVTAGVDLDQDGKKEFMVPVLWLEDGEKRRSLFVFEATGNNSYDNVWGYQFPGIGDQFVTVDVSDLDGDGNQEILAVNVPAEDDNGPNLYVFEYKGSDNDYGTEPTVTWDLGSTERDIVRVAKAADLDNDGKQEVVLTCFNTQPAIVIASVSDFNLPVWTSEYVNNEIGGVAPDIAAIGIGDMDNDGTPEVVLTEGATDKLLIIEATGADAYAMNEVDMPVAAKTVSVHGIDVGDVNGDGRDETYIANLQGSVWVIATNGDASVISTADIYRIADTEEQWLEAALGDLGAGGADFVIAASNGCKAVDYRYVGGQYGDVTNVDNYQSKIVVDSSDVAMIVPGGVRVYGLDLPGDMDGDGLPEIIFTRGSTRGGHSAPAIFIMEVATIFVSNVDDESLNTPTEFGLMQNYPNPFNPGTVINYTIAKSGNVRLAVYNVLGQKVRSLVNDVRAANSYSIHWNGRDENGYDVPSGIYYYRLETNNTTMTKRMLLIH